MKKITIFAIAALATVGLSSCLKEKIKSPVAEGKYTLNVRFGGSETRNGYEDQATATASAVTSGQIFVFDAVGTTLIANEVINKDIITTTGQELATKVPAGAQVYVVANMGEILVDSDAPNLAALKAIARNVSAQNNYKATTLVNVGGAAETIIEDTATMTATAAVTIAPAVARIEVTSIADDAAVTQISVGGLGADLAPADIKITGVWITSHYPNYNLAAAGDGNVPAFDSANVGLYTGLGKAYTIGTDALAVSELAPTSKAFAYQVPAGNKPLVAVRIEYTGVADVGYNDTDKSGVIESGEQLPTNKASKVRMLYVTDYSGLTGSFVAGKVYRLGAITFNSSAWGLLPEVGDEPSTDHALTVSVTVNPWEIVPVTPVVGR